MKAQEWRDRGRKATDCIEAFSNYWRGFNNLFSRAGKGQEREKIRRLLSKRITEEQAQDVLKTHAGSIDFLLSVPVVDMRGNGKDTRPHIVAFGAATDAVTKLQELFMVIYQVRCNLEHGEKSPSRARDVRLCESAAPIVADGIRLCG